jgi:hypothetical protein
MISNVIVDKLLNLQEYIEDDGLERTVDSAIVVVVKQNKEPKVFKKLFPEWDTDMWNVSLPCLLCKINYPLYPSLVSEVKNSLQRTQFPMSLKFRRKQECVCLNLKDIQGVPQLCHMDGKYLLITFFFFREGIRLRTVLAAS